MEELGVVGPYEGAKPMLVPDVDDREALAALVRIIAAEVPAAKKKK